MLRFFKNYLFLIFTFQNDKEPFSATSSMVCISPSLQYDRMCLTDSPIQRSLRYVLSSMQIQWRQIQFS
jgi:hypothetical protein